MKVELWLTILAVGLLAFNVWLYLRSRPSSADRFSAQLGVLIATAMIVGLAPQWLWPRSRVRIAGSIASILISLSTIVFSVRRVRGIR